MFLAAETDIGTMMIFIWFSIILVAGIIEAMTMNLTSIWLAIGAFITLLVSVIFPEIIWLQITIFIVSSTLLLMLVRPLSKKYTRGKTVNTNADGLIGKIATCIKPILDDERGEVRIEGKIWTAISNENIQEDEKVVVLAIKGVKLVVKKQP